MQNAMVEITHTFTAENGSFGGFSDPPCGFCISITDIVEDKRALSMAEFYLQYIPPCR
jgi:hypothetical protein